MCVRGSWRVCVLEQTCGGGGGDGGGVRPLASCGGQAGTSMSSPHATEEAAPRVSASETSGGARPAAGPEVLAMGGGCGDSRRAGSSAGERPAVIIAATSCCRRRAAAATRREGMARTWHITPRMASCTAYHIVPCISRRAMHRASCDQRWRLWRTAASRAGPPTVGGTCRPPPVRWTLAASRVKAAPGVSWSTPPRTAAAPANCSAWLLASSQKRTSHRPTPAPRRTGRIAARRSEAVAKPSQCTVRCAAPRCAGGTWKKRANAPCTAVHVHVHALHIQCAIALHYSLHHAKHMRGCTW